MKNLYFILITVCIFSCTNSEISNDTNLHLEKSFMRGPLTEGKTHEIPGRRLIPKPSVDSKHNHFHLNHFHNFIENTIPYKELNVENWQLYQKEAAFFIEQAKKESKIMDRIANITNISCYMLEHLFSKIPDKQIEIANDAILYHLNTLMELEAKPLELELIAISLKQISPLLSVEVKKAYRTYIIDKAKKIQDEPSSTLKLKEMATHAIDILNS